MDKVGPHKGLWLAHLMQSGNPYQSTGLASSLGSLLYPHLDIQEREDWKDLSLDRDNEKYNGFQQGLLKSAYEDLLKREQ